MPGLPDRNLALLVALLAGLWLAMLLLGGPGSAADAALLRAAHHPGLVPAARLLTRLGDLSLLLPLALAAAAWLALRRSPRAGFVLLVLVLSGRMLVELQKAGFDRARPDPAGHLVAVQSMAFPSGHAAHSTIAWLGIALLAAGPRRRLPFILLALLLAAATGLTRVVLAVHWPSDVIGGWAFGAAWTLLLVRLAARAAPDTLPRVPEAPVGPHRAPKAP
jgi:undecaprenyl-diphosphatase